MRNPVTANPSQALFSPPMRRVSLSLLLSMLLGFVLTESEVAPITSQFLDSRETYDFVELMPEEVDAFFFSQLANYSDDPDHITFEQLDQVARDINEDIADRMLEPRRAILKGIAKLSNESGNYVEETLLDVCRKGAALRKGLMDEIATVFPVIPKYIQSRSFS
uniref:DUF4168 domain-containing protein n=1 Tax=Steinernema glaseri TaxID=37863 RepID=A0A1I7Y2K2_9BILA